jgi:hypothetical protein
MIGEKQEGSGGSSIHLYFLGETEEEQAVRDASETGNPS